MEIVGKAAPSTYSAQKHTVDFVLSNEALDRDGESILHTSWRNKDGSSVPFLFGHNPSTTENVLGSMALRVSKSEKALIATASFSGTVPGQQAEQLVAEGTLDSVSVGFIPYGWTDPVAQDAARAHDGAVNEFTRADGDPYPWPRKDRRYTDTEAVEGSLVPIPSNRDARAKWFRALADAPHIKIVDGPEVVPVTQADIQRLADDIAQIKGMVQTRTAAEFLNVPTVDMDGTPVPTFEEFVKS